MDQSGNPDDLAPIGRINGSNQLILLRGCGFITITFRGPRLQSDELTPKQILQKYPHNFDGNVEPSGQIINRPRLWSAVPKEEQRLEMRDTLDLIEDELIDVIVYFPLLTHDKEPDNSRLLSRRPTI